MCGRPPTRNGTQVRLLAAGLISKLNGDREIGPGVVREIHVLPAGYALSSRPASSEASDGPIGLAPFDVAGAVEPVRTVLRQTTRPSRPVPPEVAEAIARQTAAMRREPEASFREAQAQAEDDREQEQHDADSRRKAIERARAERAARETRTSLGTTEPIASRDRLAG